MQMRKYYFICIDYADEKILLQNMRLLPNFILLYN